MQLSIQLGFTQISIYLSASILIYIYIKYQRTRKARVHRVECSLGDDGGVVHWREEHRGANVLPGSKGA